MDTASIDGDQQFADTVRNMVAWYSVFDVKPRETLNLAPTGRVRIW